MVSGGCKFYSLTAPSSHGTTIKILLFEDFDRYLEGALISQQSGAMSDILNTLDGINSGEGTVRFFTGNNCDIIFRNSALINRMSACFKFDLPGREMYEKKLDAFLSHYGETSVDLDKKNAFLDLVVGKVTLRPFVNYIIRYLFEDGYIDKMIENIHELVTM